jgi:hypothetical protein
LAACEPRIEYRTIPLIVPDGLIAPVKKPNRALITYKDAVIRDSERGAIIDKLLEDRAEVRKIVGAQ